MWLDQDEVDEENNEVVLDVFIREPFAPGTLCEADPAAELAVVGGGVRGVEGGDGVGAFDADVKGFGCGGGGGGSGGVV